MQIHNRGSSANFKGKLFKVNDDMSCKLKHVIYVVQFRGCNEHYIGETVNLRNRIILHNQHIRHAELRKKKQSVNRLQTALIRTKILCFPFLSNENRKHNEMKRKGEVFHLNIFA